MLAVKYTAYGSSYVESTNDCQSVFDIIYNSTGNHELAMMGYSEVCKLHWGQSKELTCNKDKVTVICYNETEQIVDNYGRIVSKKANARVLSVEDAARAIVVALSANGEMSGVIFRNEVWTARVEATPRFGARYFASFEYHDGRKGTVEIQIAYGRPVLRTPGVQVIQPIMDKVAKINERIQGRITR